MPIGLTPKARSDGDRANTTLSHGRALSAASTTFILRSVRYSRIFHLSLLFISWRGPTDPAVLAEPDRRRRLRTAREPKIYAEHIAGDAIPGKFPRHPLTAFVTHRFQCLA